MRFFNTTGPCFPWDHYMLPPQERLVGAQLHRYIHDSLYWVLHAPRQTGKTTFLQSWMREINAGNEAVACYVSVERCQGVVDAERCMPNICIAMQDYARWFDLPIPEIKQAEASSMLTEVLTNWSEVLAPKPLIVLFDEVDVLEGDALINFLRQLRGGFAGRGIGKFPVSVALVGMRDLKDYLTASKNGVPVNPGSPFNIKSDSAFLSNFTQADVEKLFAQRTEETGQSINKDALEYVYEQSYGQPWIVNSLFNRAVMRVLQDDDFSTVTLAHIKQAREQMVLARETHLDALAYRMENPQIRRMMETILTGAFDMGLAESEAFRLCTDLGLVRLDKGALTIANPLYREVLARQMTFGAQIMIHEPEWQWEKPDGTLDMDALLQEFQKFWRRNSELWEQKSDYTEAFPHLLLMAFLQRVLNGGGNIEREYAAGRGRMDLFVEYKQKNYIIEIKLIHAHSSPEEVCKEGLEQVARYRDKVDAKAPAYLAIFDRRPQAREKTWDERLGWETEAGITLVWC